MKTMTIAATATAILLGTSALAGPVEDLVAQLEAEGYTNIKVEEEDGQIEVEGLLNGMEREVTFDAATGEILSDETEAEDEEDDPDEDEADDDKDDDDKDDD